MTVELRLEGASFDDIAGFWREVNRVFMADEEWRLGESLDALEDMLHGGYGAARGDGPVVLHWRDMEASRRALGVDATRGWLEEKLTGSFDAKAARARIEALQRGEGQTYFDIVMEIFAGHPRFTIIAENRPRPAI
ncbi:hypothetical protein QCN27_01565 [Cereibacter sp. SYSU M97828]|nr:hypothetical protein [Cereibacter flavus]